jgi:hypothetical protein
MATQNKGTRGLSTAAASGIGAAAGALAGLAVQHPAARNLASQQRQHWELLSKAIDDPELAEVLDIYEGSVPPPGSAAVPVRQRPVHEPAASTTGSAIWTRRSSSARCAAIPESDLQGVLVRDAGAAGESSPTTDEAELGQHGRRVAPATGGSGHGRVVGRGRATKRVTGRGARACEITPTGDNERVKFPLSQAATGVDSHVIAQGGSTRPSPTPQDDEHTPQGRLRSPPLPCAKNVTFRAIRGNQQ